MLGVLYRDPQVNVK